MEVQAKELPVSLFDFNDGLIKLFLFAIVFSMCFNKGDSSLVGVLIEELLY